MSPQDNINNNTAAPNEAPDRGLAVDQARAYASGRKTRFTLNPNMTWILAVLFMIIIATAAFLGSLIRLSYLDRQFNDQMVVHVISLEDEGSFVHADYQGVRTNLMGQNLSRALRVITNDDRHMLHRTPELETDHTVVLTFSTGAVFRVSPDPDYAGAKDRAFVVYEDGAEKISFALEGYKSMEWLTAVVVPDGQYGPNQVIKGPASPGN